MCKGLFLSRSRPHGSWPHMTSINTVSKHSVDARHCLVPSQLDYVSTIPGCESDSPPNPMLHIFPPLHLPWGHPETNFTLPHSLPALRPADADQGICNKRYMAKQAPETRSLADHLQRCIATRAHANDDSRVVVDRGPRPLITMDLVCVPIRQFDC